MMAALVLVGATPGGAGAQTPTAPPVSQGQQLVDLLALGRAEGCASLLDVVVPDPTGTEAFPVDAALVALGSQIGNELRAICASSAVSSASALGGAMNSLQATKTASQFRLVRRRIDQRLQAQRPARGTKPVRDILFALLQQPPDLATDRAVAGLGVFGELEFGSRDRVSTTLEKGFDSTVSGFSGGIDYARGNAIVGGWLERSRVDADFTSSSLLVGAFADDDFRALIADPAVLRSVCGGATTPGAFEQTGTRAGLFAGVGGARGPFVDGAATWGRRSHDYAIDTCAIENEGNASFAADVAFNDLNDNGFVNPGEVQAAAGRGVLYNDSDNTNTLTTGDTVFDSVFAGRISGTTDIHEVSLSARAGAHLGNDPWTVSPRAIFTYTRVETDPYVETGSSTVDLRVRGNGPVSVTRTLGGPTGLELAYDEQSRRSLLLEGGAEVARQIRVPFGAIVPHVSGYVRHEFDDDLQLVTVRMAQDLRPTPRRFTFATDGPDPTSLLFAFGASALVGEHFATRIELSTLAADDLYDATVLSIQARWRF